MASSKKAKRSALEKALSGAMNKVLTEFRPTGNSSESDDDFVQPIPVGPKRRKTLRTRTVDEHLAPGPSSSMRRSLPSSFLLKKAKDKAKERVYTYNRDIICLPKSFMGDDGLVRIPRKRDVLAVNKLIGKISLESSMSQFEIMDEIRSVFATPMGGDPCFPFNILQKSGCGSKCLAVPEVSSSYEWSASVVAGRDAKSPIYILARDKLNLQVESSEESEEELPSVKWQKESSSAAVPSGPKKSSFPSHSVPNTPGPSTCVSGYSHSVPNTPGPSTCVSGYSTYISLLSDDEENAPSPSPPPLSPFTPCEDSDLAPLKDLIRELRVQHLPLDEMDAQRIVVRRKHIFEDSLHRFKCGLDFSRYIKVTFVGEPAADEGGPLREFFSLLMCSFSMNSSLFCGKEGNKTAQMNPIELSKQTFLRVGEMIATSLVHGGPAAHFFSDAVADYILFGMAKLRVTAHDVPDHNVKDKLLMLQNVSTDEQLKDLVDSEEFAFRYDIGIGQPSCSMRLRDKEKLFHLIALHFAVLRVKPELDQLIDGLKPLGVLEVLRRNPIKARTLLVNKTPTRLSADTMLDMFAASFSQEGSNRRCLEEAVMVYWANFLHLVEGGNGSVIVISPLGVSVQLEVGLNDIMAFVTGCPTEPPAGFQPQPSIHFQQSSPYPSAHTCSNVIHLPLEHSTFDLFAYFTTYGMVNTAGFGNV